MTNSNVKYLDVFLIGLFPSVCTVLQFIYTWFNSSDSQTHRLMTLGKSHEILYYLEMHDEINQKKVYNISKWRLLIKLKRKSRFKLIKIYIFRIKKISLPIFPVCANH